MYRFGVVVSELLSVAVIVFVRDAIGDGTGPGKAYLCDALRMLPGEQKLVQDHGPLVFDLADDAWGILLRSSVSHGNALPVAGFHTIQFVDDVQHVMAASFFSVGHDVDARPVLVPDRRKCSLVQQFRELV